MMVVMMTMRTKMMDVKGWISGWLETIDAFVFHLLCNSIRKIFLKWIILKIQEKTKIPQDDDIFINC